MIVFNAESTLPRNMLTLCVENILPYAHEVIIVEGATKASNGHPFDGHTESFTKNGRSTDGTIFRIRELELKHQKVKGIIGKGFWPGKTSMCNAAANMATGNYILQLDSDEFYKPEDMEKIIHLLESNPQLSQVDFYANCFIGSFNLVIDETNGSRWGNDISWRRIFHHTPGKSYWERHEPPVFMDQGLPTYDKQVFTRDMTLNMGIKMFHYSYVHEPQFKFKEKFYGNPEYGKAWDRYVQTGQMEIFGIRPRMYTGDHPVIIEENYNL